MTHDPGTSLPRECGVLSSLLFENVDLDLLGSELAAPDGKRSWRIDPATPLVPRNNAADPLGSRAKTPGIAQITRIKR
jgi:hypothetical protein